MPGPAGKRPHVGYLCIAEAAHHDRPGSSRQAVWGTQRHPITKLDSRLICSIQNNAGILMRVDRSIGVFTALMA